MGPAIVAAGGGIHLGPFSMARRSRSARLPGRRRISWARDAKYHCSKDILKSFMILASFCQKLIYSISSFNKKYSRFILDRMRELQICTATARAGRCATGSEHHDEPPRFAMLNLTRKPLGIAYESQFQGLGISDEQSKRIEPSSADGCAGC